MAKPPHTPDIDRGLSPLALSPEQALIAAILRVAVSDARSTATYAVTDGKRRHEAQQWLRNRPAVEWWIDLADLPDWTYDALLSAAGIEE